MKIYAFFKSITKLLIILLIFGTGSVMAYGNSGKIFIRVNQVGYLPNDAKTAIVFSNHSLKNMKVEIVDLSNGKRIGMPVPIGKNVGPYGNFNFYYRLDFSFFKHKGRFKLQIVNTEYSSLPFGIAKMAYRNYGEDLLKYIRQQRCGYNPFLDEVCHRKDGRTAYGPMPDGTYIDVSGGWHDAGDYLKYLMTSGNTVCRLLFAYREFKGTFQDSVDALGHPWANGIADILDEAKWGLDWMFRMHPAPNQLFHQVGDDRDHVGWVLPDQDTADYGWGPGSYRVVYYANGKPQGLGKYKNTSTGIANLAGRYAAAMAMASDIWKNDLNDPIYAARCLKAGIEVYNMGLKQPGCQEGTPHNQPYRYYEKTWADDMEWGAAELFRVTRDSTYLNDAKRFARIINSTSWMGADTARHYEYYPFVNIGHYALYPFVKRAFQDTLTGYYRSGIEKMKTRALKNPYHIAVPFIWCSNNLVAAFITQCLLYEKMTGDLSYHNLMLEHRDWLLGRNPWGVSQFVGIPASGGVTPHYPHSVIALKTGRQITGGLVDGPVYASIFDNLKGIRLFKKDKFAEFQSKLVVYHDDTGDYSTNEPTLDGTAEAMFFLTYFANR